MSYNFNMLNFLKRNKHEKESNIASSPEQKPKGESFSKFTIFFWLWNILSIGLYTSYTLFIIYHLSQKNFLSRVIIYMLYAYIAIFILIILINIGNRKKMRSGLKNYKSATKFLKYAIQILNFVLSIATAISAFITTGTTDLSAIAYAVLSLIVTGVLILFEIAVIIVRKNIPIIKRNFLEIREKPVKKHSEDNE